MFIFHKACLAELIIGVGFGWIAPVLSQLKNSDSEFSITEEECSWIASQFYIGRAIGPLLTAISIDRVGRNPILILTACVTFLMWIVIWSTRAIIWHYITRLMFGIVVGMFETTVSIYIGENCSPEIRGTFSALLLVFFYAGELIAFILTTYLPYDNVAIINGGLGLLTLVSTLLLREPAQFLVMKGHVEKAERNYTWLRGCEGDDVKERKSEFEDIRRNVVEEKSKTSHADVFRSSMVRKSFRIVVVIMFLMMFTGFPAVSSFVTMVFSESKDPTPNEFTILHGLIQLVGCCISSCIIDKVNRRTLLLITCVLSAVTQSATAILYHIKRIWDIPYFDWLLFATLTTYSSLFGMFVFPLTGALRGELLPQSAKAVGGSVGVAMSSVSGFVVARIFLPIANQYGTEMNFVLYSVISLCLFIYVYFDLPETRGKSLIEIQKELKKK